MELIARRGDKALLALLVVEHPFCLGRVGEHDKQACAIIHQCETYTLINSIESDLEESWRVGSINKAQDLQNVMTTLTVDNGLGTFKSLCGLQPKHENITSSLADLLELIAYRSCRKIC